MTEPYRSQLIQMLSDLSIGILKMLNDIRINFSYYQSIVTEFETMTQELRKERISQINTNDLSVESLGDVLEASSVKILSLQAPVGRDLRMVLSSFRIIYDVKRISRDTSHSFAGLTSFIGKEAEAFKKQQNLFMDSINAASEMLDIFETIYRMEINETDYNFQKFIDKAEQLDDIIDDLFENHSKVIIEGSNNGDFEIKSAHKLLSAIRALERVGDHCTNIIESAIYIKSGVKVQIP